MVVAGSGRERRKVTEAKREGKECGEGSMPSASCLRDVGGTVGKN